MSSKIKVQICGSLKEATGGLSEVEVEAATLDELLTALEKSYPGFRDHYTRQRATVCINGYKYDSNLNQGIAPGSEVIIRSR